VLVTTYLFIQVDSMHVFILGLGFTGVALRTMFVIQGRILSRLRLVLTRGHEVDTHVQADSLLIPSISSTGGRLVHTSSAVMLVLFL